MRDPVINFQCTSSKNYKGVQEQILASIARKLPLGSYIYSTEKYIPELLNFTLFIAKKSDVLMSHGAADKSYHWKKDKLGKRYNTDASRTDILVPGRWLRDRIVNSKYLDFDANHVHIVGWPRLDDMAMGGYHRLVHSEHIRKIWRPRKTILWAPTHDRRRYGQDDSAASSYPAFEKYIKYLENEYHVTVSLHPRNRGKKKPTRKLLLEADIVISDFGTLVYEAWALGKPVIFPDWLIKDTILTHLPYCAERHIFEAGIGLHPDSFEEMMHMLKQPLSVDAGVKSFLDQYLAPEYFKSSAQRVADVLLMLANRKSNNSNCV